MSCRLCAFEATKVKVQTVPGFANGLSDGLPKIVQQEGFGGYVLGISIHGMPNCVPTAHPYVITNAPHMQG
jgi:hypothetical protein